MTRLIDVDATDGSPMVLNAEHVSALTALGPDQACVYLVGGQVLTVDGTVPDLVQRVWPRQVEGWNQS